MRRSNKKQWAAMLDFNFDFPEIQDFSKPSVILHKNGSYLLFKPNDVVAADALAELVQRMGVECMRKGGFYSDTLNSMTVTDWRKVELWKHLNGDISKHPFCELLKTYGVEVGTSDTLKNYIRKEWGRRQLEMTPYPAPPITNTVNLFERCSVGTNLLCTKEFYRPGESKKNEDSPAFEKGKRYMVIGTGGDGVDEVCISLQALVAGQTVDMTGNGLRHNWSPFDAPMEEHFDDSENIDFGQDITQKYPQRVAEMRARLLKLPFMVKALEEGTVPPIYPHTREDAPLEALKRGVVNCKLMRMGKTREAITIAELWGSQKIVIIASRRIRIMWLKNLKALGITDFTVVNHFEDLKKQSKYYLLTRDWLKRRVDPGKKARHNHEGLFHSFVEDTVVERIILGGTNGPMPEGGWISGVNYGFVDRKREILHYNLCPHCNAPMVRPSFQKDSIGKIFRVDWTFRRGYMCRSLTCQRTTDNRASAKDLALIQKGKIVHGGKSHHGAAWAVTNNHLVHHQPGSYVDFDLAAHAHCNQRVNARMCPSCKVADGVWVPPRYRRVSRMFTAVIDDEIHNEKNHTAESAEAIFNLRARRRLGLTGTFMSNSAMDTYGPLHYVLAAPCVQFPYARQAGANEFEKRFCDFVYLERPTGEVDEDGNEITKTVKKRVPFLKNPPEFWRFLADKIVRRNYDDPLYQQSLKEAGLIQPIPDVLQYVSPMDPKQAKMLLDSLRDFKQAYEQLVKEAEAKHQEVNLGKIQNMSQMMSMRILATCPEMINQKLGGNVYDGPVGGGKMFHISKIVAEKVAKNGKVLIISDFIQMQKTVTEELRKQKFGILRFNPAWNDAKCEEAFDQFNDDPDIHGMVAGTRAIREGLDFSAANTCLATDLLWSPAFQTQAWSRILTPRPEDRKCEVYLMLSKSTIDEHVYNVFYSKMMAAEQALDRVVKERRTKQIDVKWFVERILEEEEALSLQVRDLGDKDEIFMPSLEEALLEDRV